MCKKFTEMKLMRKSYRGIPASEGMGTGKVVNIDCSSPAFKDKKIRDTDRELGRFVRALKTYCNNTRDEIQYIKETIGEQESKILAGHIQMTHDPHMQSELIRKIGEGICAERATSEICDEFINRFLEADVEFVKQIATDVKDVKAGVITLLLGKEKIPVEHFDEDVIVVTKELTPSVAARLDRARTKAIVTEIGSPNSHSALLLKAMNIPSVTSIKDADKLFKDGDTVTVNGDSGEVFEAE